MTRQVTLLTSFLQASTVEVVLCDKYLHPLGGENKSVEIGTPTALEINENDTCWVATLEAETKAFWVYEAEGDAIQVVDLDVLIYPLYNLPSFSYSKLDPTTINAEKCVNALACETPIVVQEEKHFVCRYEDFTVGDEDVFVCEIDNNIGRV